MSACLTGIPCGWDGTNNGAFPSVTSFFDHPCIRIFKFCPEDYAYGTPRLLSDIYGGNGYDVLDGKAKVMAENGEDWTSGMLDASRAMGEFALEHNIELAILLDVSAACGSQVIYEGNRLAEDKRYQKGPGVAAAQLMRHGIQVISQRDYASLEILFAKVFPEYRIDETKTDHHETEWYKTYFGNE